MGVTASALHRAAGAGDLEAVADSLRQNPKRVNARGLENETPLHIASMYGHVECVVFLLAKGANVNATNITHATPLFFAASRGHLDVVRVLCDNGADMEIKCRERSPLMAALWASKEAVAMELLKRGASVTHLSAYGYNARLVAEQHGMALAAAEIRRIEAGGAGKDGPLQHDVAMTADKVATQAAAVLEAEGNSHLMAFERAVVHVAGADMDPAAGTTRCLVCFERDCTVVALPCRHLVACAGCAAVALEGAEALKARCPVCRVPVEGTVVLQHQPGSDATSGSSSIREPVARRDEDDV